MISLFQTDKGKIVLDNNEQAVFEIGDKYVVAYCTRVTEDGIAPMKDVETDIRFQVTKEKKAEIISSEFEKNSGDGKSLEDIAASMGLSVQDATQVTFRSYSVQGAGVEPALIAAASSSRQGEVSGPVKGENGVYMLSVNNLMQTSEDDLDLLRERLNATYQMRGSYEAYEALRKAANIVDKRYKFY